MTEEGLITGIEVTGGESADGQHLISLVEQSVTNGIDVNEVLGDTAYSTIGNIEYCKENEITLVAKLNPRVVEGAMPKEDGFFFNKDAGLLQCPANELATRGTKRTSEHGNDFMVYFFSKVKCRHCPLCDTCKVGQKKTKSYCITIVNDRTRDRITFEQTAYFNERLKIRYRIEAKYGELKQAHGLRRADSTGLASMRQQAYFTAFTANIKRIVKLIDNNGPKEPSFFLGWGKTTQILPYYENILSPFLPLSA